MLFFAKVKEVHDDLSSTIMQPSSEFQSRHRKSQNHTRTNWDHIRRFASHTTVATQRWLVTVGCSTCWSWCQVGLTEITGLFFFNVRVFQLRSTRSSTFSDFSSHCWTRCNLRLRTLRWVFGNLLTLNLRSNWTESVRTGRRNTTKGMPKKKRCSRVYVPQLQRFVQTNLCCPCEQHRERRVSPSNDAHYTSTWVGLCGASWLISYTIVCVCVCLSVCLVVCLCAWTRWLTAKSRSDALKLQDARYLSFWERTRAAVLVELEAKINIPISRAPRLLDLDGLT